MEETNYNLLTKFTGDPFADTGGLVIEKLWTLPQFKDKPITILIEYVANIYVNHWGAKLHAFFLNSKITQPAFKGPKKIEETLNFYNRLLNSTEKYEKGYCRILGIETKLFYGGRDNSILAGSGTFLNFHHSFQGGMMLSKEALIRMFFVPLGSQQLSDKIAVISSNNYLVTRSFVFDNVIDNISRIGAKIADGVLKSEYNNPASGLFEFVHSCLVKNERLLIDNEQIEISMYHFTNFGASPEVLVYVFSAPLFNFYKHTLHRTVKGDWQKFVRKHYYNSKNKDAVYKNETELFVSEKKKISIEYDEYKKWVNWIYQDLLKGKNILPAMLNWNKKNPFNFKIVRLYQINIKNMDNKTLDKIEELADYIISDQNKLKKRISMLNRTEKVIEIRRFILRLISENHSEKNEKVLVSLRDYVNYLFPDGTSAKEIRDLLLIALYQKMHENNFFFGDDIETTIETENN